MVILIIHQMLHSQIITLLFPIDPVLILLSIYIFGMKKFFFREKDGNLFREFDLPSKVPILNHFLVKTELQDEGMKQRNF